MKTGGKGERDRVLAEDDLNRATVFMLVGMLSIGVLAGFVAALVAACLLALLGGG